MRPQLRFSKKAGWNNDVNGLVYDEGEWHLFYQYCPTALRHADKFWGHAVSKDLIHWEELPIALSPFIQAKGQCFSGSTVVDHQNTAGFQTGAMNMALDEALLHAVAKGVSGPVLRFYRWRPATVTWIP